MFLTQEDLNAIDGLFSKRFDGLERRMDGLEQRMDKIELRMDQLELRMDKMELRMDRMESDISALKVAQQNTNKKLAQIAEKVDYTYHLALENWGTLTETRAEIGLPSHA